jgi:multicomponent Na+:H+ antiporter subunit G
MTFGDALDLVAAVFLVLGGFLSLAAGIGLGRFPDALSRLHAATKPQILGLIFVVLAIVLTSRSWSTLLIVLPVIVFQMLTAPISAHMVGRAGYRASNFRADLMTNDDLAADIEKAADADAGSADAEPGSIT